MTTRLLVSVRDRHEALDALSAGADLIDLKEPRRGSLGAVDAATMYDVATAVAGRAAVSVALGELLDAAPGAAAQVPGGVAWAKFGLAGCALQPDWCAQLALSLSGLPRDAAGVAVAYVDDSRAAAPSPDAVLSQARAAGCRAVLVDTWCKRSGALLDLWTLAQCRRYVERVQAAGLVAVLGGSLTADAIARLLPLAPDYIAVRGAVCRGARHDRLDPQRVRELAALIHREPANARR